MKKKTSQRYLFLRKETITLLDFPEMGDLRGGCTTVTLGLECKGEIYVTDSKISENTCYTL